ncbi:MAG: autotransporter outer membrane beta-barrel domain-containing protein [Pseudomonas sp.]|nr:autotransporter outer membrane beta-barrel domain-containing protein [Pseudomonas sp.]
MKMTSALGLEYFFYAVSTSMLLATSLETLAFDLNDYLPTTPASSALAENRASTPGTFWSQRDSQGWHVDASASGAQLQGVGKSSDGNLVQVSGQVLTLSLQGGIPFDLSQHWTFEPQAQLINQQFLPGTPGENSSPQSIDAQSSWSGRVGAKLSGRYEVNGLPFESFVRTSLLYNLTGSNNINLDQVDKISSSRNSPTVEVGLGLVAKLTSTVSMFVSADYSSPADQNDLNGLVADLGVRMRW